MRPYNLHVDVSEETVETRLEQLLEMKLEYKAAKEAFDNKYKSLKESMKSLENIITDEVLKTKKTVVVGNIKAEYVPSVVIKVKKECNNDLSLIHI